MQRIPEPELMNDAEQALAYAQADFSEPHNQFVDLFKQSLLGEDLQGRFLDLGCGPADICIRLARAFPRVDVLGIDGAEAMLSLGQAAVLKQGLQQRISLRQAYLPMASLPQQAYTAITSNSLLHHLADPLVLWQSIQAVAQQGTNIFIMDLMRPASEDEAKKMVETYAADEPEILRRDFYHSLLAAYRVDEVAKQMAALNISGLQIDVVSDRHFTVHGQWR